MKTKLYVIMIILVSIGLASCGSSQSTAQKQQIALEINEKVNNLDFIFKANHAYPTSMKPIYLSPYYDVKVSQDTIIAYLPYYGRAYTAPMDNSKGGIQFTSTSFEYDIKQGKKSGNWLIDIKIKDQENDIYLLFDIWDSGTARLSVSDTRRQSISFTGDIEVDK